MYKEVLRSINGIGLYPVISLIIFFLFFVTVFLWVTRMRREEARALAALPLDESEINPRTTGDSHHG
jgi:cbb3-type cytochrome oxidase subunit 3